MAAQRAAIRRGLAIRRAPHRPPRGRRKSRGHRSILAPSASGSRAATLARALLIIGVGLALARAERERRAAAAARARLARSRSLLPGEPTATGLRRVVLGQLELAIELLEGYPAEPSGRTVHETRKALKRLRALLRLLRDELGGKRFRHENAVLRGCARRLAGPRDAEAMVDTLDALARRHPKLADRPSIRGGVRELRAQLLAEREAATAGRDPGGSELSQHRAIVADLRALHTRVLDWELHEDPGDQARLPAPGLERIYREGRRGLRRARRRRDIDTMHAWRKSAKHLRYAAETFEREAVAETSERGTAARDAPAARREPKGKGKAARRHRDAAKRIRRTARRADRLGEILGEEHDLALLARIVRKRLAGKRRARKALLKRIERRRKRLRRRALREGERLYRRKPKPFVRGLRDAL